MNKHQTKTNREKFKRRVIELIHWCEYEEAIKIESKTIFKKAEPLWEALDCTRCWSAWNCWTMTENDFVNIIDDNERILEIFWEHLPITLWRVMQAMKNTWCDLQLQVNDDFDYFLNYLLNQWKFIKENWEECTDDDQTDETIEKLLSITKLNFYY